ncbi:ABC transporter permease subunit [Thermoleptolyngbya sp. C42_A2020_037]|uniref:ABC transporter permease n=1 Tax=Thermoleptolyngbya sp. C42_A2020_037 TaxID=2747799 RepID=UPI001A0DE95A|nr:ABC transporter permease subunit [Thermoleptolyngbya sp. C42_A2020_037]MBF2087198.1 ABC transporter permease subunit [Thermoleptolyngbya sp. C42_A2020_037]
MTLVQPLESVQSAAKGDRRWDWLGLVPFFAFAFAFLILPALSIAIRSFQDNAGQFTLQNILDLRQPSIMSAYAVSIRLSIVTALIGGLLGALMAYAVTAGGLPEKVRSPLVTFSGVASNFAGVPLAFAFIATLGRLGLVTGWLKNLGLDLYAQGFNLYTFWGLMFTYLYFQIPLTVLILVPAFDGLRREWREAAENLGASSWDYWRQVALPILMPSLLGTMILLFGNAFGAHATAYALTGGQINLVTILIDAQIRGDALQNPGLGNALALGMVFIMAVSIALYSWLQRRTSRWVR